MATKKKTKATSKKPAKKTAKKKPRVRVSKAVKKVLKKVYSKKVLKAATKALNFNLARKRASAKPGTTITIPKHKPDVGGGWRKPEFDKLQKQVASIEKRLAALENGEVTQAVTVETPVGKLLPLFDPTVKTDGAPATLPPGIEIAENGNVEIDPDETWRWSEADMLTFVSVAKALQPPALDVHAGRPRKMRKVLFDWMRAQGLEPTDLPPKGAEMPDNAVVAGFTGPREGMTAAQAKSLRKVIRDLKVTEWHHGDCLGADEDSHEIALQEDCAIVVHPPSEEALCAKTQPVKGKVIVLPAEPYHTRNHSIVDATQTLVATPESREEELHSGTWATVRYARKVKRPIVYIWPDGKVEKK